MNCICEFARVVSPQSVIDSVNSMKFCDSAGCYDDVLDIYVPSSFNKNNDFLLVFSFCMVLVCALRIKKTGIKKTGINNVTEKIEAS